MDINLKGQFFGMPTLLTCHITTDWLTVLIPVLVVFLAAFFTYFITVTIERQKHRRELKSQAYFELLDLITKARKVETDSRGGKLLSEEKKGKDIEIAHALWQLSLKLILREAKNLMKW